MVLFFAVYIWRDMPKWMAVCGFVFGLLLCVAAMGCLFIRGPEVPEVTAKFVHPQSPMLILENISGAIARDLQKRQSRSGMQTI